MAVEINAMVDRRDRVFMVRDTLNTVLAYYLPVMLFLIFNTPAQNASHASNLAFLPNSKG